MLDKLPYNKFSKIKIVGRDEETADSNTELAFEYEEPDSGCVTKE